MPMPAIGKHRTQGVHLPCKTCNVICIQLEMPIIAAVDWSVYNMSLLVWSLLERALR